MKRKNILIVEDDPGLNKTYARFMPRDLPQYSFCVVEDGSEAIEQMNQTEFDLVITDLSMPEVDGDQLYAHALTTSKKSAKQVPPFIFCSGVEKSLNAMRAVSKDSRNRFFLKPFPLDEIYEVIVSRLESN